MPIPPALWTHINGKTAEHGKTRHHPNKIGNMPHSHLQHVLICQHNSKEMEGQTKDEVGTRDQVNPGRRANIGGSTCIPDPWTCCADVWMANNKEILARYSVCQSILWIRLRLPTKDSYHRRDTQSQEIIQSLLSQGVQVRAYHTDNGVFYANQWVKECFDKRQQLAFTRVNAHHSNGLAESCTCNANSRQLQMAQSHNNSSVATCLLDDKQRH